MVLFVLGVTLTIVVLVGAVMGSVTRVGPDEEAYRFVRGACHGPVEPGWTVSVPRLYTVEVVDSEMGPFEYDVHTVTSDDVGVTVTVEGTISIDDVEGFVNPHAGETTPLYYGDPTHTLGARIVRTGREELRAWSLDALTADREDIARRLRRAIDERLREDPISVATLEITAIDAPAADRSGA